MRSVSLVFGVVIGLVGCGKDKAPVTSAGSGSASGASVPAGKDFVALLVAQSKPSLVGPFAALKLGPNLSIGEARGQAPDLVDEANVMKALDWFEYKAESYGDVSLRTERFGQIDSEPDTWLVGRLRAVIPDQTVKERLAKAWGEPTKNGRRVQWFDPPSHLRCGLEPSDGRDVPVGPMVLDCDYYVPLAELIGTDKTLFGFEEGKPLLGMTDTAVKKRWGRRVFDEGSKIMLPPAEKTFRSTTVQLGEWEAPSIVTYFTLKLSAPQQEIDALLSAKFGPGKETDDGIVYRAKPRVVLAGSDVTVGTPPAD